MRWFRSADAVGDGRLPLLGSSPLHALWFVSDEFALSEFWFDSLRDGFGEGEWSCWRGDLNAARSPRIREHKRALGDLGSVVSLGPGQYTVDLGPLSPVAYFDAAVIDAADSRQLGELLAPSDACYSVGLMFSPKGPVDLGPDLAIMLAGWLLSRDPATGRERAALLSAFLSRATRRGVVVLLLTKDEDTKRGVVAFGDDVVLDQAATRLAADVGGQLTAEEFQTLVSQGLHLPFCT